MSAVVSPCLGHIAATISNITASEQLYRIGIVSDLLAAIGVVVLTWALYVVLKPINRNVALVALLFWVCEACILGFVTLFSMIVLMLSSGAEYLAAFEPDQLHALALLSLKARFAGFDIALLFFGFGSGLFAYLFFKSKFVPRLLALLGIVASIVMVLNVCANVLFPLRAVPPIGGMSIFSYELLIGFWLLFRGINQKDIIAKRQSDRVT
ncbi:DUF4386 domain-containing protein [bacterium AH-315-P15]|nr:DUF4386 domain-containing protein [bacterium AH-315-P15]